MKRNPEEKRDKSRYTSGATVLLVEGARFVSGGQILIKICIFSENGIKYGDARCNLLFASRGSVRAISSTLYRARSVRHRATRQSEKLRFYS